MGLSLAFMQVSVWLPSITIGVVTAALSALGVVFAARIGREWGAWASVAGGCVLIVIGTRILIWDLIS